MAAPTIADLMEEADNAGGAGQHRAGGSKDSWRGGGPPPDVDAENSIPSAWKVSPTPSLSCPCVSSVLIEIDGRPYTRRDAPSAVR